MISRPIGLYLKFEYGGINTKDGKIDELKSIMLF